MTVQWQKVHIFISSTFNDMHAERDYLVKRVFPELADWCERRKLRLVDVDLEVNGLAGGPSHVRGGPCWSRQRRRKSAGVRTSTPGHRSAG